MHSSGILQRQQITFKRSLRIWIVIKMHLHCKHGDHCKEIRTDSFASYLSEFHFKFKISLNVLVLVILSYWVDFMILFPAWFSLCLRMWLITFWMTGHLWFLEGESFWSIYLSVYYFFQNLEDSPINLICSSENNNQRSQNNNSDSEEEEEDIQVGELHLRR